jgi:tetratricopeptide (TPR) repeat protein
MLDWLRRWWGAPRLPPELSVTADRGSVAAGRDISNSVITIGVNEEYVRGILREELARIAEQKQVPMAPLTAVAVINAKLLSGLSFLERGKRLAAAADELYMLRQDLQRRNNAPPDLTAIRSQALALIDAGDLAAASAALKRGRDSARASREKTNRGEAELLADEARIDHLRSNNLEAAKKYAEAASLVAPFDRDAELYYLLQQANERSDYPTEEEIAIYRRALILVSRNQAPLQWATIQNDLGDVLRKLGERGAVLKKFGEREDDDTGRLEEAVTAYREALKERTRERAPREWAVTQENLGDALRELSERKNDAGLLEEAVMAYREALKERTRERLPLDWARIQNVLGISLRTLGERESDTTRIKEAVTAHREALKEYTLKQFPYEWAATQLNLGDALRELGEPENDTGRLEEAVTVYRDALTLADSPIEQRNLYRLHCQWHWSMTQNNLGLALTLLGQRGHGTTYLEEAIAAFREALKERGLSNAPLDRAMSIGNQGVTLMLLAERSHDCAAAERALAQVTEAFDTLDKARHKSAAHYKARLPAARALIEHLRP